MCRWAGRNGCHNRREIEERRGGLCRPRTCRSEVVKMAKPFEFIQEVRQEVAKVTWPTRKEVMITTAMVLVMVVVASLFFLVVDQVISWLVGQILGLARR